MRQMNVQKKLPGAMGWAAAVLAACVGIAGSVRADSVISPATQPALPAASATASTQAAKTPPVDDLLPKNKAAVDLEQKTIPETLDFLAKTYGLSVTSRATDDLPKEKITLKPEQPMAAKEAIDAVNDSLLVLGFTIVKTAQGDPPQVVLTVVPTRPVTSLVDPLNKDREPEEFETPVGFGNDPDKIPEGDSLRTQVFTLKSVDPAKARETIASVLSARATVTVDPSMNRLIVTDSGTHVHTAAALLAVLEKQADATRPAPAAGGGN